MGLISKFTYNINYYFSPDPTNGKTIAEIQKSIFILNLDRAMPETKTGDERYSVMAAQMNHGGGSAHNTGNRWFDKTLQVPLQKSRNIYLIYI